MPIINSGGSTIVEPLTNVVNKYTFKLYVSDIAMLRELVEWAAAANVTQALRAAVKTYHYLRHSVRNGDHIFLEGPAAGRRELVFP